ncbi:phage tail tape measure protein [Achromobacter pulmonis]|uniref:Phage tail tape measure protein n=1 Tax=Achromobacter pulmonis TaxID=1389932 RepID=A0A2N8KDL4_9BURK|nr:phage tail tape measure protein [Achromobacter pulmonis]PND31551.1 phage tail tape measure protein [Achromobacter pulmonis]
MTEKTLGVRLTGDESDLLRAFSAGSAASAQFAAATETTLGRASAAAQRMGASSSQMSVAVNAASAGAQAYATAGDRFLQSLERQAQAIGKTRSELLELRAAELGVAGQAAPLISRLKAQEAALNAGSTALNKHGMSAAQTAAAMRGVPAQITDIVVSLQSGQQPMTVMLQQGGQLKDMFGGIVPAARALGSTLMGLVNPYTLLAGAAVAFGVAAYQGHAESERFNRTIRLTGNYAGVTAGSIREMSAAAAQLGGGGLGKARQAVESLVATGQISKDTISSLSATMVELRRVSGQSMDDISKDFARMPEGVTKWAEEHNRSMNFMSLAQWDYIRTLEETGNREAAMQATSRALHDYLGTEAPQKLGFLERAWKGAKQEAEGYWEVLKSIGRDTTLDEEIKKVQGRIRQREQRLERGALSDVNRRRTEMNLASDRAELSSLQDQKGIEDATEQIKGLNAAAEKAAIEAKKELLKLDLAADKGKQLKEALKQLDSWVTDTKIVSPNDPDIEPKRIEALKAYLRKQYEDKDATSAGQNGISAQLAAMQAQARLREEALRQENTRLEGERARGLLSEEQFIHKRAEAQRAALQDELEVVRRQAEIAGGKKQLAERERYLGRVKELEAQIVRSHAQEATDIEKYQEKIRGAIRATELDIKNYVGTRDQQVSRQINAMTLGANDRALVDSINQAQDRFRRIRDGFTDKVLREGGARALDSEQYQQGIAEIDAAMLAQVERERGYMQQRVALQADWKNGALLAVNEWVDGAANLMGQSQQVFSSLFSGMENVVASFATTGKTHFSDFTRSVLADISKIAARQAMVGLVTGITGSLFGLGSGAAAGTEAMASSVQAAGGDGIGSLIASNGWVANAKGNVYTSPSLSTYSNGVYDTPQVFAFAKGAGVFAEAGPEAIMPLQRASDGSLGVRAQIPNWPSGPGADGGYRAGPPVQVSIYLQEGRGVRTDAPAGLEQFGKEIGEFVDQRCQRLIARSYKAGGASWNRLNGR